MRRTTVHSAASAQLTVSGMLALMAAMAAALAAGLLAWGPVRPGPPHLLPGGILTVVAGLTSVLPLVVCVAGFAGLRRSNWPAEVARPWRLFFVASGGAAFLAGIDHLLPDDTTCLMVHLLMAAVFTSLLAGFMAERVHPRWGSRGACVLVLLAPVVAAVLGELAGGGPGVADLRGFLLLELLPLLLIPAGALALTGRGLTTATDWVAVLTLCALARACEFGDAALLASTGLISGHTLTHVSLAIAAGLVAYRAFAAARAMGGSVADESSQRITSASTPVW